MEKALTYRGRKRQCTGRGCVAGRGQWRGRALRRAQRQDAADYGRLCAVRGADAAVCLCVPVLPRAGAAVGAAAHGLNSLPWLELFM